MVIFAVLMVIGAGMFAGSIVLESKAPPVTVGEAALPPSKEERVWGPLRVVGTVVATVGLVGFLIAKSVAY